MAAKMSKEKGVGKGLHQDLFVPAGTPLTAASSKATRSLRGESQRATSAPQRQLSLLESVGDFDREGPGVKTNRVKMRATRRAVGPAKTRHFGLSIDSPHIRAAYFLEDIDFTAVAGEIQSVEIRKDLPPIKREVVARLLRRYPLVVYRHSTGTLVPYPYHPILIYHYWAAKSGQEVHVQEINPSSDETIEQLAVESRVAPFLWHLEKLAEVVKSLSGSDLDHLANFQKGLSPGSKAARLFALRISDRGLRNHMPPKTTRKLK